MEGVSRSQIEVALDDLTRNLRGFDFQRIAITLACCREPQLAANEVMQDGGEDAFWVGTDPSDLQPLAIACSITANWSSLNNNAR
jgi:hypothetical protein